MRDCFLFFVYRRVGSCILNKRRADVCQVEGVEKCRVSLLSFFLVFSLLLHDVVLVAECGLNWADGGTRGNATVNASN